MVSMIFIRILFALFSIHIARADIKTGAVPRLAFILAFPFFIMLKALLKDGNQLLENIFAALAGLMVFLLAYFLSGRRLGLADVWYSALIGLVLGLYWWYAAIGLACVTGIAYIIVAIITANKRQIPFIPCMAFGSITMIIIKGFLP